MLLGHWQEMKALGQAQDALAALAALLPDEAERVGADGDRRAGRPRRPARPATSCWSAPGARVPADGEIVEGAAELDESMITGESKPVAKDVGDRVVAGTVSTDSAIRVRVDAVGEDTALAGIQRLVAEAQDVPLPRPGRSPTGPPRCCSTSPPARPRSPASSGWRSATPTRPSSGSSPSSSSPAPTPSASPSR